MQIAKKERPKTVLVKRKGTEVSLRVYPVGETASVRCRNAPLARATERRFKAALRAGWEGTLEELVDSVEDQSQRESDAFDRVKKARERVQRAEDELKTARRMLVKEIEAHNAAARTTVEFNASLGDPCSHCGATSLRTGIHGTDCPARAQAQPGSTA